MKIYLITPMNRIELFWKYGILKKKAKDINSDIDKSLDMFDIINYHFELIEDEIDIDRIEELLEIKGYEVDKTDVVINRDKINQLVQAVKQLNKKVKELENKIN